MEAHSPSSSAATGKAAAAAASADSGGPKTFFCYLLHSLANPSKGHTYIGFTVNPLRRLKQHNGTLRAGGARHTASRRPWAMVAVVHGFPTKIAALQFEWAWQYPRASRLVRGLLEREAAGSCGSSPEGRGPARGGGRDSRRTKLYGTRPRGQLNLLYAMLSLQPWCHYALHVRYLRQDDYDSFHASSRGVDPAIRARLPPHMDVSTGPLEELEWASTLTKTSRKAAQARGQGDTPGAGEAVFLDVPPSGSWKDDATATATAAATAHVGRSNNRGGAAAAAYDDHDDDVDVELEAEETEHEVVFDDADHHGHPDRLLSDEEDDFCLSQRQPAAAVARALALEAQERSDRAFAQALARAEYGYDPASETEGAASGGDVGFRFDAHTNSFVLVDEENEEVDLTRMGAAVGAASAASAASASAAAAISIPAAAASSSSAACSAGAAAAAGGASSHDPACALCDPISAGSQPPVPQLSQFGFHKLRSVCPYCSATAHLLCFQRRMQLHHDRSRNNSVAAAASASTSASASDPSSASPAPEVPLLPAPAPCPFCAHTLPWCMLVENSHRYHAPTSATTSALPASASSAAAAAAAAAAASSVVAPRTLGQYFLDAGAQFRQIARLHMMHQWRATQAAKLASKVASAAKKLRSKTKGAPGSSSVASSPAPAPAPASALASSPAPAALAGRIGFGHTTVARWESGENKENAPVGSAAAASASASAAAAGSHGANGARKAARKRRSRSISPTRAHAHVDLAARGQSPSSAALAQRDLTIALAKKPKRCATPAAAAAAAVAPMPLGPLRSLSLSMMHADNLVAPPVPSSESKRAALVRAATAAAAAAAFNSIPVATMEELDEDGSFDRAWCGSQSQSQSQLLRGGVGSQRSGAEASEGSEIDLTETGTSLWDRCSAAASASASTASVPLHNPARPYRSSSNGAARVAVPASRPAPLSPIRIEDSDCDSVGSGSPTKRAVAPRPRAHPPAAAAAAATASKPHKFPNDRRGAEADCSLEEVGLMERLKTKYGLEQIVLSL